ncbi:MULTISPECIES: metalloregulator ArsR/SmtB family transcription factor [unclassified Niallia]|uniref:helix-turn-helix transcriptional regulator n=1 Tax=unclassified Niallia TaxID=2837522 RepID=UPI001EDA6C4E|nr:MULTISPECIES: metalloregulator ArsR/SmtB family transcription factor [unclassified Niallia]MDL0436494.1 transcriptional regulator [Niallia sp. SS-2023]UPO88615.1 transcriptional regulator [Niallia sp. Man26]
MDTKQKNTKDKILHLLKKEGSLTVSDLTKRLEITHMAVRKHLTIMEKDGMIQTKEFKQSMGRPMQLYSLTEKAEMHFPKNYEGISIGFLRDIEELYGDGSVQRLFEKREARLIHEYAVRMDSKDSLQKMKEITKIQNEKGYMAELNQLEENTYELIEYNCPILEVAKEFKIACKCETEMFKDVLNTENISRSCCRTDGDSHCRFLVKF